MFAKRELVLIALVNYTIRILNSHKFALDISTTDERSPKQVTDADSYQPFLLGSVKIKNYDSVSYADLLQNDIDKMNACDQSDNIFHNIL